MTTASETITEPSIVDLVEPAPEPATEVLTSAAEPEVPIIAPDTDTAETETGEPTESAEPDAENWVHPEGWTHDWLDFKGDRLAIRIPQQNALVAINQAAASCSPEFVTRLYNKFVQRHISEESRQRVLERMSDPDDADYAAAPDPTEDADDDNIPAGGWNELVAAIVKLGGDRAIADAEALAAVKNGNRR